MSRIEECFAGLAGRKAMIAYITAGDPDPACTVTLMHAMVAAGVDVIELGVPFSDPMADGPVIQRASERALAHHVSLRGVLSMVSEFRKGDARTPVVLMGYLNPIEVLGYGAFARSAAEAGVDGVLTVDMPPEEAGDYVVELQTAGLAPIFLIAPTTTDERVAKICALARGFVYYVSLKGVTGAAHLDVAGVTEKVERIRHHTSLPIAVGFGIKDAAAAARVARVADGVVVGSALVQLIEGSSDGEAAVQSVATRVREIRAAMDEAAV